MGGFARGSSDGTELLWITSILKIRPFDYYKNINIPVLFVHGEKDYNVAVESTMFVQENLPGKLFEYIYYQDMKHSPAGIGAYYQQYRIRNDITKWINSIINK
jgi:dipeptidyl aminopeptidase/acylaminoacyl peptidase